MTEQAGWDVAGQLPPSIARRLAQADAQDAIAAREAEEARELRAESSRSANLALYREQAARRGEEISVLALAQGRVAGRTVGDILAAASAEADAQDARAAVRATREADGG